GPLYTASSCCCQAPNLPWAPIPPPHAAARPVICHGPPYRLVTLLLGPQCDMGPCTTSHCSHSAMCHFQVSSHSCWFPFCHRLLADYRPPIGAARPQICHGPPYRLVTLLLGPQCDMGPCTASHCSHSAMCHFEVSSHSCWFPFCHRLLYGLPLLLPPPP
ncbi:unnamed protein product, partial [Staurois parvus]